ncbi:stage II sporulation protein R [Bacillus songklensis]|uniref:Stage II sporulation protein R n=1 Tax=Bacillus songklensis TaxID=1069116 RepID=A0ABV8B905_9BACI
MKKYVIIYFLLLLIGANSHIMYTQSAVKANEPTVIPDEAIRLRILANSDSDEDQALKREVRDRVNEEINKWVKDLTSIEEARKLIKGRLHIIKEIAEEVVEEHQAGQNVEVKFGKVRFPTKLYGQFLYPAGEYEAILITLGEGEGANWWCVLFPPLCFLDFSNGEAVKEKEEPKNEKQQEGKEQVEVKFFLVELFSKLFN